MHTNDIILRKHQAELVDICRAIRRGENLSDTVICEVTPGGGKSLLPVILAEELVLSGWADHILWIVPRNALREQGERDFCLFSSLEIRCAPNGKDMRRGTCGYITTYQAIAADPHAHYAETSSGQWIVFADEPHHVAEDSVWHRALAPIVERAALRVFATGTAYRADMQPIAFFSFDNRLKTRIVYSRSDALRDKAVCPVSFVPMDGEAEWKETDGTVRSVDSLSGSGDYAPAALFTALRTEFADHLLETCLSAWQEHRVEYRRAKLLVVAPNIREAKRYRSRLSARYNTEIATSDDTPTARSRIRQFKGLEPPECDVLVTVAMAYEGLSVPEVTHIACLTHIRSVPWLEQCFARANRLSPGKTGGVVYGPDDPKFREAIAAIESEQQAILNEPRERKENGSRNEADESRTGEARPFVQPLRSGLHGYSFTPAVRPVQALEITPSEAEKLLRTQIHRHIEVFLSHKRPGSKASWHRVITHAIREICPKPRSEMTSDELTQVWIEVLRRFPLDEVLTPGRHTACSRRDKPAD